METVEYAPGKSHQGDKKNIGKCYAGQIDGELVFFRVVGKSGGDDPDQKGHDDLPHHHHQGQHHGERGKHRLSRLFGLVGVASLYIVAEHRHERGAEGPLGKKPPQEIGQLQGDEKGVGPHTRPKKAGDDHIADETENP